PLIMRAPVGRLLGVLAPAGVDAQLRVGREVLPLQLFQFFAGARHVPKSEFRIPNVEYRTRNLACLSSCRYRPGPREVSCAAPPAPSNLPCDGAAATLRRHINWPTIPARPRPSRRTAGESRLRSGCSDTTRPP